MNRFAVIPTRGDRDEELRRCVQAITPQVDRVIVVDNSDNGVYFDDLKVPTYDVVYHAEQPPNLSRLWNLGLQRAEELENHIHVDWEIAVLNDDAIVPPFFFEQLSTAMRSAGAAAGSYCGGGGPWLHTQPGVTPLSQRLCGWAFMLNGGRGLRADERLRWWCGDNDLDMQARLKGGTLVLPGDPVQHLYPDQSTRGVLAEQTALDMMAFVEIWGFRPWAV